MDRVAISRLLAATERRTDDAAQRVARQRRLVAGFERTPEGRGENGRQAAAILEQLELSHRIMIQECERLRRELGEPTA